MIIWRHHGCDVKADRHFHDPEFALAGHEQFEQILSVCRFGNGGGQFPPEGEKSRGGVVYVTKGAGNPVGEAREPSARQGRSFSTAAGYVAAADGDVAASVQQGRTRAGNRSGGWLRSASITTMTSPRAAAAPARTDRVRSGFSGRSISRTLPAFPMRALCAFHRLSCRLQR